MLIDRREFLLSTLAAPAVLTQKPSPRMLLDRGFARIDELTDGVWITHADPSKGPECLSNGGIIVGREAVLLVEGHFQPRGAALEVEAARLLSKQPIRGAVNTHFHLDHSFGNRGYASESIPIIAHENAPALMRRQYADERVSRRARTMAAVEEKLAQAGSPADTKRLKQDAAAYTWMFDAIDAADLVYATELVKASDGPMRIDLGGLEVLLHCHSGHTPGDLTVHVPSRDVMFVGDLIFQHEYPVTLDADMRAWRTVIDSMARQSKAARIVPGHGPVCDRGAARALIDLFDDLGNHAERMKSSGVAVEEAERRYVVPARFRDYDMFSWTWTIGGALRSHYAR